MAKKICLKKMDLKKIRDYLDLLKQHGINPTRVILFGSYAKGCAKKDSDIDIVIVSSQFGVDAIKEMIFLRKLAVKIDSHIEPIPLNELDLNDQYSSLVNEIKLYGKEIKLKV